MKMTMEQLYLVQSSFKQVEAFSTIIATLFYNRLYDIAPHLRERLSCEARHQGALFVEFISSIIDNFEDREKIESLARDLRLKHHTFASCLKGIPAIENAFFWTLEEVIAEDFTPEVRSAWVMFYQELKQLFDYRFVRYRVYDIETA
ncbi:MAG TPA: globin domain-containing protein [Patescibacteria group bacterium]|nr:globin domain-containing protein [Patescibacteria group bacterium]